MCSNSLLIVSCTRLAVGLGMDCYCNHLTPGNSQPWTLSLATLGVCLSPWYPYIIPNLLPASCCLALPFFLPSEFRLHSFSKLYPYILPIVEHTIVGLSRSVGKLHQGEFGLHHIDCGFAQCSSQLQLMVTHMIFIIMVRENHHPWGHEPNSCSVYIRWFCWQPEMFHSQSNGEYPRCTRRTPRCMRRVGRYWHIGGIVSWWFWTDSPCTWRWWALFLALLWGNHLGLTINTLVEVISLPQWPIT